MGVLTGFMLIGISLLIKDVPEFKKGYRSYPPAPPYSHILEESSSDQTSGSLPIHHPPQTNMPSEKNLPDMESSKKGAEEQDEKGRAG